jgi:hypothetical protein
MDSFFSEIGIPAIDFVQISAVYILTMLIFFGLRDKKHRWLNYSMLVTFILQCILVILSHKGLRVKLFAALMLMTALIAQITVTRRRKLEARERSAAK